MMTTARAQQHVHSQEPADTTTHYSAEKHLSNIRQLTFGGDNAEAYFSFDSKSIVFQATNPAWNASCDQIFSSAIEPFKPALVSTGLGEPPAPTSCRATVFFSMPARTVLGRNVRQAGTPCGPQVCMGTLSVL